MKFTEDCKFLVSSGDDDKVRVWDLSTGKCGQRLVGYRSTPWLLDMVPDARKILTSGKGEFFLQSLGKTGTALELDSGDGFVREAHLRQDGRIVLAQCGGAMRLIDAETGSVLRETPSSHFAASPDCKRVAVFLSGTLALVDPASGRRLLEFEKVPADITRLKISERGGRLAALAESGEISIWDFRSGRLLRTLKCAASTNAFHLSKDGRRIVAGRVTAFLGSNSPVVLWDVETGNLLLEVVHGGLTDFRIGADCRTLLTIGDDAACRIWLPGSQPPRRPRADITQMTFSPDGRFCAVGDSRGSIRLIDAVSGQTLHDLAGHRGEVRGLAFSPEGMFLASGAEREIGIWKVPSGERLHTLEGHSTVSTAFLEFTPDSNRLVSSGDCSSRIRVWDAGRGKLLQEINAHEGCVSALRVSDDGKSILSASSYIDETGPKIWELATGRLLRALESHCCGQGGADASREFGSVVSVFDRINLWNGKTGELLKSMELQSAQLLSHSSNGVRFFPDGKKCAVLHCDCVRVWDTRSLKPVLEIPWRRRRTNLSISPDGRHFAFLDQACRLFLINAETESATHSFHRDATAFAIDWERQRMAVGNASGMVEFSDCS